MAKTAAGLVAHAKAQLGLPYVYGTFGQVLTQGIIDYKRKQYPRQVTAERAKKAKAFIGKRTYDCAGLIKSYWMKDSPNMYNAAYDKSAAGLKSCCKIKGKIPTIPEEPGVLVFIGTSHVGVYIGGGQVIEARGFNYGVVQTALNSRGWDTWGRLDWLEPMDTPAKEKPATASQGGSSGTLKVGDRVRVRCVGIPYYPGFKTSVPAWLDGKIYTVNGIDKTGKYGGVDCARLKEITSWCAVSNLMKV